MILPDKLAASAFCRGANRIAARMLAPFSSWFSGNRLDRTAACLLLLAGTPLMSGCTPWREYISNRLKVGPNFCEPEAPVAPTWIDAENAHVRSSEEDTYRWWSVFNDPVLEGLVQTAYNQNLTVRQASFRVMQARAQLNYAKGGFFPQTQAMTGDAYNESISRNAANRGFVGQRFYSQFDYGFNVSWELDFWGRLRRIIESADGTYEASIHDYDALIVTMLGDVSNAYVQIRTVQKQIAYTQANVELQVTTLELARARFEGGATSDLDVEQARTVLGQTKAQIPLLEIQLRTASNMLCILMGMPPSDLKACLGDADIPTAPPDVAAGIPLNLLERRPDVLEAERTAAAQCAQIGVAQAEFYPHIYLNGTLDYQAQSVKVLLTPASLQSSFGPSYSWNILNYGRLLNNVRSQEASFNQLVTAYQSKVLNAAMEVENGLVTYLKSQDQARFQQEAVTAANKAVELAVVQYREGRVDFNRVAVLQQTLVQEQNLLAQARGQIASGLINVYRALGGGWQIRLEGENADDE